MMADTNELQRAYAILGLSPPISEAQLKRRYKALVRRWHPDRYEGDQTGKAEATLRLRGINVAYEIVAASLGDVELTKDGWLLESRETSVAPPSVTVSDRPFSLSKEQVDAIVDSINRSNRLSLIPEMS